MKPKQSKKRGEKSKEEKIDCCWQHIDEAVRKGRGWYICPKCGKDVSLIWYLYQISNKKLK